MSMITKLEFMIFLSTFLFFIIPISNMMGTNLIKNAPTPPTIPPEPTVWNYITYPFENLGYFFRIMSISTEFQILGLITSVFIIALIWCIIELVRGV